MLLDNKKIRNLFETLKSYSSDKEKYMSEMIGKIIFILINRRRNSNENLNMEKIELFIKYITSVLKDLYADYIERSGSKKNIADDIEFAGVGFTSIAIRVGDNVLKVGKTETSSRPIELNSAYQVPTYIRESYEVGIKTHFRVEVAPYVDTGNITYEDLYNVYSSIRKLGYIWNDPKEENLGRIIGVSGCKIGGKKYLPTHPYKEGDLVLIDLDDIAYVGEEIDDSVLDEIATMSYNRNVYIFEMRYMKEREEQRLSRI